MKFNLPKLNAILIAIALVVIVIGFALMTGAPSGATEYNPDIFSFRREGDTPYEKARNFCLSAGLTDAEIDCIIQYMNGNLNYKPN